MYGNYTNKELFRMTGTLPTDRLEELIEDMDALGEATDVEPYISEALGQFPAEDFLQEPLNRLSALCKRLRGENKEEVLYIIEMMDDIAQCTFNAAEYGRDELNKARKSLQSAC